MYNIFFLPFCLSRPLVIIPSDSQPNQTQTVRPLRSTVIIRIILLFFGQGKMAMLNFTMYAKSVLDIFLRHTNRRHREITIGTVIRGCIMIPQRFVSTEQNTGYNVRCRKFVSRFNAFAYLSLVKSRVLNIRPRV